MMLINKTKNTVIAEKIKKLVTWEEKSRGLSGKDVPEAVYFKTRWGIHSFGMKFDIDCIVADKNMVVRKVRENMKTGKLFFWNPRFHNVIELPAGTLKRTGTELSDRLAIDI